MDVQAHAIPSEVLADARAGQIVTRVLVRVHPSGFLPRSEVASLPAMQSHQILTAPRVTIYPLEAVQMGAASEPSTQATLHLGTRPVRLRAALRAPGGPRRGRWWAGLDGSCGASGSCVASDRLRRPAESHPCNSYLRPMEF